MKALVVSIGKSHSIELNHNQNEFSMLLKEIDYEVASYFSQDIESVDKNTYVGSGKIHETQMHQLISLLVTLNYLVSKRRLFLR